MVFLHAASNVAVPGGSHPSPLAGSTQPSLHFETTHVAFMHTPEAQSVQSAPGGPWTHFCPTLPSTVTAVHASRPLHGSSSEQASLALSHVNLQSTSHPVPGPFPAPKSQSSPASGSPLPHFGSLQAPALQTPAAPHALPSCAGSAEVVHAWASLQAARLHSAAAGQSVL